MASFGTLPNELVESVVQHLQDRKIDSFDIVAIRDLQSVRLVCKTLHSIATPKLFHNMILDFKLWDGGDHGMRRLVTFAAQHPALAKLDSGEYGDAVRPLARHLNLNNEEHGSNAKLSAINDILISPLKKWQLAQEDALCFEEYDNRTSLYIASTLILDTFRSLPNLYHVEHALSVQDRIVFGTLEFNVLGKTGVYIDRYSLIWITTPSSFEDGFDLIIPHIGPSIISLKLRDTTLSQLSAVGESLLLATLRHLDLEVSAREYDDFELHGEYLETV